MKPPGITIEAAALRVGVTRQAMSNLVNAHSSMSIRMALAVSCEFGRTAEDWMHLQTAWDLWHIRQDTAGLTHSSSASNTG